MITTRNEEYRRMAYAFYHGATKQLMKMYRNEIISYDEFMKQMNEQIERLEKELEKSYSNDEVVK